MRGRVIKNNSNVTNVFAYGKMYECLIRGKIRQQGQTIRVGDMVVFDENQNVIDEILPRKTELLRPPISNIDQVMIMIAPKPAPDFYLVDQIIINAIQNNIKPILVLSKSDLKDELFERDVNDQYSEVIKMKVKTSIEKDEGLKKIQKLLKGKLTAIIGQSGVGKSTLINKLVPTANLKTGELSEKIERGVNTTRSSEIFVVPTGGEIIDTPGFSLLQLKHIAPNELASFYSDIAKFTTNCAYKTCNHIRKEETECGVIDALKRGKLNPKRYARYVELYNYYSVEWDKRFQK